MGFAEKEFLIENGILKKYFGSESDIIIPDEVTEIGLFAFSGNEELISVTIPNSVKTIAWAAFENCSNLVSITFPDSIIKIAEQAFKGCTKLPSISIPQSVAEIGPEAFKGCSNLASIMLPDSAVRIGPDAFRSTAYYDDNTNWENHILYIGRHLIRAVLNVYRIRSIKAGTITIGGGAFKNCTSLSAISIPNSITMIGDRAFESCVSLASIAIPASITEIGRSAFNSCASLSSVSLPDSITEIADYAFFRCSKLTSITIPDHVTTIGTWAFRDCTSLSSIIIPESVTSIGGSAFLNSAYYNDAENWKDDVLYIKRHLIKASVRISGACYIRPNTLTIAAEAFKNCTCLTNITLPDSIQIIGKETFSGCSNLVSIDIPCSVTEIGNSAFSACSSMKTISISANITKIGYKVFEKCSCLATISLPNGVTNIGESAFESCSGLESASLPESVTKIDAFAFQNCTGLTSIVFPPGITEIGYGAFKNCHNLSSIVIPPDIEQVGRDVFQNTAYYNTSANWDNDILYIGSHLIDNKGSISGTHSINPGTLAIFGNGFSGCDSLTTIIIPNSVKRIIDSAFGECPNLTIVCSEDSYAHKFCKENRLTYIFDYQFEAFHGVLPPGIEMLASPFLADEERPYIFVSYSHKDRDIVLEAIKVLYESGWKIWYDEGLTVGDLYDETIEEHVKNCSAFLLFVTENSQSSRYIRENEIPWAVRYGKPIIECIFKAGSEYAFSDGAALETVVPADVDKALQKVEELKKGHPRRARGISVISNPADRDNSKRNGFAYCIYSDKSEVKARSILLEANNNGCILYDAVINGTNTEKIQNCACILAFLDQAFLSDKKLTEILITAFLAGKNIAVCQIGDVEENSIPQELFNLYKQQWLNYTHGMTIDLNTQLSRHLQKMGCRDVSILPGFSYKKTTEGIVIIRYYGMDSAPKIERDYGGVPVIKIANNAFQNRIHLKSITIPDSVTEIGKNAFDGCTSLASVTIPDSVTTIQERAFQNCSTLTAITIPDSVTRVGYGAFQGCSNLTSVAITKNLKDIPGSVFRNCTKLVSISIPNSITRIGRFAFDGCSSLSSITIPDNVTAIDEYAFQNCVSLSSVTLPDSITTISELAFHRCISLTSITIPDSVTKIGYSAFADCSRLALITIPDGVTVIGEDSLYNTAFYRDLRNWNNGLLYIGHHLIAAKRTISGACDIKQGTLTIGEGAFQYCSNLALVTIPYGVTRIGSKTFDSCSSLRSVAIPEGVTEIRYRAFGDCSSLRSITIPSSVSYISPDAFGDYPLLTIHGPQNSYVEMYAKKAQIPFVPIAESET